MVFSSVLLVLGLYKAQQFWKMAGFRGSRLVMILIRDQVYYYAVCVSYRIGIHSGTRGCLFVHRLLVCSACFFMLSRYSTTPVLDSLFSLLGSPTILCILGSQVFFNLKEAAEHNVNVGTNWDSYSHSAIDFDARHLESDPCVSFSQSNA